MQSLVENKPLIAIVGPTAVGKTEVSLQLAEDFEGEIVSADSRLLYRGMDIGTAKPTKGEMARVPHHLIDVANPDKPWSLVKFIEAATQAIDDIHQRERVPFLVGGTGQYIMAILEGWRIPEVRPNERLRIVLSNLAESLGPETLHQHLAEVDPKAASQIDPKNVRRSIRALEVIFSTGQPFSKQKRREPPPYRTLILGITRPRDILYDRIDRRIDQMVKTGFIEEVKLLLENRYSPELPPLSAIGYRQMIQFLSGEISLDEAIILMKRLTRNYVRRQANWFKEDDLRIRWFDANSQIVNELKSEIYHFLTNACFHPTNV